MKTTIRRVLKSLAALYPLASLLLNSTQAQVPTSIAGDAIGCSILVGTSPFAPVGYFFLLPADTGNSYKIAWILNGGTGAAGTYAYTKTSETTGVFDSTNNNGIQSSTAVQAETPSTGTFTETGAAYPSAYQDGQYEIFAAQAPTSIIGKTFSGTVVNPNLPYPSIFPTNGVFTFAAAKSGNAYTINGSGAIANSTGTYSYSTLNTATGVIQLMDSFIGTSTIYVAFSSTTNGGYGIACTNSLTITNAGGVFSTSQGVLSGQIGGFVLSDTSSSALTNLVLNLDGNGSYVTIPNAADLQADELTLEAWIYPTQTPNDQFGSFINKGDGLTGSSQRTYEARWQPSGIMDLNFYFNIVTGLPDFATISVPVLSNQWTHVAASFSSSAGYIQIFTNGVLAAGATNLNGTPIQGRGLRQTTLPVVFGWTPSFSTTYASGSMDEIRIWSRVLTQAEIAGTMSCRLTGAEPGLAGYWNFDGGLAADVTGHGYNGTLYGNAAVVQVAGGDAVHAGCTRPFFTGIFLENNLPKVLLTGPSGRTCQIDTSTNLLDWSPWITLFNFSGTFQGVDASATNSAWRFYRAVEQ